MPAPALVTRLRELVLTIANKLSWLPPTLARLAVGWVFVDSGWGKLHNIDTFTERFTGWGIPFPHFNAILSASAEFFCGLLVLIGLLTRVASVPLIFVMIVALATVKVKGGDFVDDDGNRVGLYDWMLALMGQSETLYIVLFAWLATNGPGPISLDRLLRPWAGGSDAEDAKKRSMAG